MIGSLGQPVLFLLGLGFGFGSIFRQAGQGNYIQFLSPGVILMTILFNAIFTGTELIWDRQFGFLKEMLVSPVPRLLIMTGRTLGGATVAVIQGLVVTVICVLAGFRFQFSPSLIMALVYMALTALLFTAMGTALASVLSDFQGFQLSMGFLIMPMFFLSGSLAPLNNAPRAMSLIASIDPVSYGVDGLRYSLIGLVYFGAATDLAVLSILTLAMILLGGYLFSKIQL